MAENNDQIQDINKLITQRLDKPNSIKAERNATPNFRRTHKAAH